MYPNYTAKSKLLLFRIFNEFFDQNNNTPPAETPVVLINVFIQNRLIIFQFKINSFMNINYFWEYALN